MKLLRNNMSWVNTYYLNYLKNNYISKGLMRFKVKHMILTRRNKKRETEQRKVVL